MTLPDSLKHRVLDAVRQVPSPPRTGRLPTIGTGVALAALAMLGVLFVAGGTGHTAGRPVAVGRLGDVARASLPALHAAAPDFAVARHRRRRPAHRGGLAARLARRLRRPVHPRRLRLLRPHGGFGSMAIRGAAPGGPSHRPDPPLARRRGAWRRCRGVGGHRRRALVSARGPGARRHRARAAARRAGGDRVAPGWSDASIATCPKRFVGWPVSDPPRTDPTPPVIPVR
jgi:hypothetical protein